MNANTSNFTLDELLQLLDEIPHRRPGTSSLAAFRDQIDRLAAEAKDATLNPRRKFRRDYYQGAHDAYGYVARLVRELMARSGSF